MFGENKWGRAEVGGQRIGSKLCAVESPMWGLNAQNVRSRPELKSNAYPPEPPRFPNNVV